MTNQVPRLRRRPRHQCRRGSSPLSDEAAALALALVTALALAAPVVAITTGPLGLVSRQALILLRDLANAGTPPGAGGLSLDGNRPGRASSPRGWLLGSPPRGPRQVRCPHREG